VLARIVREASALVFEGRAGIGKTTVWDSSSRGRPFTE
jgi:hypothetical protein